MLNPEQHQVLSFLRCNPECYFSAMEVSRRAGSRKQFEKDPRWAFNCLRYLLDLKLVERDAQAHYKYFDPDSVKEKVEEKTAGAGH